ncbi:MAG: ABC transporter permease, partial [Clostridia bacterium]|nr:ABC transporter permease [Clostridia bacterium]
GYESIEQCLGYLTVTFSNGSKAKVLNVGAIVKTDFKTAHQYLYDKYFDLCFVSNKDYESKEMTILRKDYSSRLALAYSINPNFEDYINDGSLSERLNMSCFFYEVYDAESETSNTIIANYNTYNRVTKAENAKVDLAEDEIILMPNIYRQLTGINPPRQERFEDERYVITVKLKYYKDYNSNGELLYSRDLKVVGVDAVWTRTSEALRKELLRYDVIPFAGILSDLDETDKVLDYYDKHQTDSMLNSVNVYSAGKIADIVSTFTDLFYVLGILLIAILCVLIVAYSLRSITANEYEIGVMKAMGVQGRKLFVIFTVKLMIVVVVGIATSFLLSLALVPLANGVLTKAISRLATTLDSVPNIIQYKPNMYAIDGLIAVGLSMAVSLVSLLFIRRIKPIQIIKTID